MTKKPYIDVVIDLETLGTSIDSIVTQVSAHAFHVDIVEPLEEYQSFNEILDLHQVDGKLPIDLKTLQFWTRDEANVETFNTLLHTHSDNNEKTLWTKFSQWLVMLNNDYTVRVWGNGILFDIGKVVYNLEKWNLPYPIKFWDERDVRTLTELAAIKLNCTSPEFQQLTPNAHHHDALSDVLWEIEYVQKAYDIVMNGNQVNELTDKLTELRQA